MKRGILGVVCLLGVQAGSVGAAPATTTCAILPAPLEIDDHRLMSSPTSGLLEFTASAITAFDCPDGHPRDGAPVVVRERAQLRLGDTNDASMCFSQGSEADIDGRALVELIDPSGDGTPAASFRTVVDGAVGVGVFECEMLELSFRGSAEHGIKLMLVEEGGFDTSSLHLRIADAAITATKLASCC